MSNQLDLFSLGEWQPDSKPSPAVDRIDAGALDDAALIAAIPQAGVIEAPVLAAEASRRQLASAVPALSALCRRLSGAGLARIVPEQAAAFDALAKIGGPEAREAVATLIAKAVVLGPTLRIAVEAAARLNTVLPVEKLASLLRHDDPAVRANACRCARPGPIIIPLLVELLHDLNQEVSTAAACALGRMGGKEAGPPLLARLECAPSIEAIDSVTLIADERFIVALARIARTLPDLAEAAFDALEAIDHPRAQELAGRLRPRSPD